MVPLWFWTPTREPDLEQVGGSDQMPVKMVAGHHWNEAAARVGDFFREEVPGWPSWKGGS